jgi:NAD+ synthase (glutamine-hydrolysing)
MNKIRICLAQMKVIPANPQENLKKVLSCIEKAKEDKAEIIVFPEMALPSYIIGDIWERESFINECMDCLEEVRKASDGITVVIGSIDIDKNKKNEDGRVRKYNTCFVFNDGNLIRKTIKTLQPNYREFDDNRHFYDNRKKTFEDIKQHFEGGGSIYFPENFVGYALFHDNQFKTDNFRNPMNFNRIAIMLCEDAWDHDYTISPINEIKKVCRTLDALESPNLFINISCSPYTQGKNNKRNRVFGNHAKNINAPIVYVNSVGVQNNGKTIYSFDGNSCIYDKSGNQINPYKPFQEGCETIEIDLDENFGDTGYAPQDDIKMVYDAIVYSTKEYMNEMGIKKVVIGASGGIDSAVVTALFSKILPARDILLVNMPSKYNSKTTKDAAEKLASNIGCPYKIIAIQDSVDLTKSQLKKVGLDLNSLAIENIQARDRSARVLAACSSSFGGPFTCNANKSEMTVGYSTMYGDTCGFISPIADLWKGQVYELAKYINKEAGYDLIPKESIEVKPSAELSKDQDVTRSLGDPLNYPYHDKLFASWVERWNRLDPEDILRFYVDGILEQEIEYEGNIRELFRTHREFIDDLERWWNNFTGLAVFKRVIGCPIIGVSRRCFGFDMRESIVKYTYSKKYIQLKKQILEGT